MTDRSGLEASGPDHPTSARSTLDDKAPADRSTVALKGFWEGDFTLGADPDAQAPAAAWAIEGLGASGIRIGGRDLAAVLAPAYRKLTGDSAA